MTHSCRTQLEKLTRSLLNDFFSTNHIFAKVVVALLAGLTITETLGVAVGI